MQYCKSENFKTSSLLTDPTLLDSSEPTTYTSYIQIFNDSIKAVPQPMSWDAAQKHCSGDDANLASLRTEWTQTYVERLALKLKTPLWIGINKKQVCHFAVKNNKTNSLLVTPACIKNTW